MKKDTTFLIEIFPEMTVSDMKVIVQVLQGVSLVFSEVVPINAQKDQSRPYWVSRSLGAFVTEKVDKSISHVVATRLDTAKACINLGKSNSI